MRFIPFAILGLLGGVLSTTAASAQRPVQAMQVMACDEKCVMRLDDEGWPMSTGCVRVQQSDGTTGRNCYVDSSMLPGRCEINFDCGGQLAATLSTPDGRFFHVNAGCQANVASRYANTEHHSALGLALGPVGPFT